MPHLALCLSEKAFLKIIKKLGNKESLAWVREGDDSTVHFLYNHKNEPVCVVCVGACEGADDLQIFGLLAHEAMHVIQEWRESVGGRNRIASVFERETEAYALHRIFQNLLYEYQRQISCK